MAQNALTLKCRSQIEKIIPGHPHFENKALSPRCSWNVHASPKTHANFQSKEPRRTHWRTGALNHTIPRGSVWHNVETMGRQASAGNLRSRYRPAKTKRRRSERYQAWGAPKYEGSTGGRSRRCSFRTAQQDIHNPHVH